MSKPKGMIFDGESIRAFKAGRKTMTRRVMKPQPCDDHGGLEWRVDSGLSVPLCSASDYCPYPPGTIVYAKETFCIDEDDAEMRNGEWTHKVWYREDFTEQDAREAFNDVGLRWKSPIFMPRWAARFWFRVTDVRAERLQDISHDDVRDEGFHDSGVGFAPTMDAASAFIAHWNTLNAKRAPWESNPWVWAYRLEPIDRPEGM